MGLVVGDALGVPYEFCKRDTFKAKDMTGYGTHNQPPGTWSDDSSMTLATLTSLTVNREINPEDIMKRFVNWVRRGAYTARGEVFDIGITTRNAISRYVRGASTHNCGSTDQYSNGNGALMRILPLAFVPHSAKEARAVAGLTHAHEISLTACEIYLDIARSLLAGVPMRSAIFSALVDGHWPSQFERLEYLGNLQRDEIKSTGYVVDTLEAALWCLLKTESYRDCVLMAVNLGDDTDTIAAVAGGLAGIVYGVGGEKGIPEKWIEQIAKRDEIKKICEAFARRELEQWE